MAAPPTSRPLGALVMLVSVLGASAAAETVVAPAPAPTQASAVPAPTPQTSTTPAATAVIEPADLVALGRLAPPVPGLVAAQIQDTFADARGERRHEATDIVAPRGTLVLAVDDGVVAKLFTSAAGGLTVYQFDTSGTWCYYYAHLDGYVEGVHEGMTVWRGDPLGYVGTTGNAGDKAPHLHFGIYKLGPEKRWWEGTPIDPYPWLRAAVARW